MKRVQAVAEQAALRRLLFQHKRTRRGIQSMPLAPTMHAPVPAAPAALPPLGRFTNAAVAPFLMSTLLWSTACYMRHCDEELVASSSSENGVQQQTHRLYSIYHYLELTTDGPRFDLSSAASLVDWESLTQRLPTRAAVGMVYWCWSSLLNGIDNTTAMFPSVDIKPKLIKMGILDSLEKSLASSNETVRLCSAYVVSRLVRNTQVARIVATRPAIVKSLLDIAERELVINHGRFVGFAHPDSDTSAEVFCTVLETLNRMLDVTVDKETVLIGSRGTVPTRQDEVTRHVTSELVSRLAVTLRDLESCNDHAGLAKKIFNDHHILLYKRYFPRNLEDQYRRRIREVEAVVVHFVSQVSKDKSVCRRLLVDRELLKSLTPLAICENRNASAFVHAVGAVHNILGSYSRAVADGAVLADCMDVDDLPATSLLVDSHVNRQALQEAVENVASRDASVGGPLASITSVYAMRCYTSSLVCLVVGGVYGVFRTPARLMIDPLLTYSVTGVGAAMLNVLYGTYGLRNWLKNRTYIEDEATHVAFTWGMVAVDAAVITAIVKRHPACLLPMMFVNWQGHNSYPGTGLKRCDGIDLAFPLD